MGAAPERPRREPRHPAWTYASFAAALAVLFALVQWGVKRREAAARRDHREAIARAEASPGTVVVDPLVPAGVVVVDLVPVSSELPLGVPATVRVGGQSEPWAPGTPAWFQGFPRDRRQPAAVAGPYVVEGAAIQVPEAAHGGRVALRAIPISPVAAVSAADGVVDPEKQLDVDLTHPEVTTLRVRVASTVISEQDLRAPEDREGPGLARAVWKVWRAQGIHSDRLDRRRDEAIVRVSPTASFAEILPVVDALLANTRVMVVEGASQDVPIYAISVQPPLPDPWSDLRGAPWRTRAPRDAAQRLGAQKR